MNINQNTQEPQNNTRRETKSKLIEIQENDKLKILCLHGYRQNADNFKAKIGSFRKLVNKYANFTFVSAPHTNPPGECLNVLLDSETTEKSWWFNNVDGTAFKGTNKNVVAVGFDDSLNFIEDIWRKEGPFQGLLGFSQGACFVSLLCNLGQRGMSCVQPEFAIMASGFLSGSLTHLNYYESINQIPSLHIFGDTDEIIPKNMSELLTTKFKNPIIHVHEGGHYFPASKKQKDIYVHFLQDRLQEHLERKELEKANNYD